MKYVSHYQCTLCHQTYPKDSQQMTCTKCGAKGILDVIYDYESMKKEITLDYFNNCTIDSMLRYAPMMSIEAPTYETLKVGNTPLYRSKRLAKQLGLDSLYIKDEGVNPTASLKDRASLVACIKAIEQGSDTICCSSTGNAASSLAGNAAKLGLNAIIFVPERAPVGKLTQLVMYGSTVIQVKGDYKATFNASKRAIEQYHLYNRNAAINPHLVEGKKTVAYEISEQLGFKKIDYVLVSVGDGCTIGGVYKGFYDLHQLGILSNIPKIIGVQSDGCSPFYEAYINHEELQETQENTIADSIAVGIPRNPVKGMNAVRQSKGFFMTVTDEEILQAIETIGTLEGIFSEPAGATAAAGLIKLVKEDNIPKDKTIVVIATGNGLKDVKSVEKTVAASTLLFNPNTDSDIQETPTIEGLIEQLRRRGEEHE